MRKNIRKAIIQIFVMLAVVCATVLPTAAHTRKTVSAPCAYMSRRPKRFAAYIGGMTSTVPVSDKLIQRIRSAVSVHAPYADVSDLGIYIPSDQLHSFTTDISTAIPPRCPDIICLDPNATITIETDSNTGQLLTVYTRYVIRRVTDEKEQKQVRNVVRKIAKKARKKKGKAAQIRYVNDLLVKRITYGTGTRHYRDAFGALVQRRAVCAGYARAFALIMNELGIENAFEHTTGHIWNRVRLGRSWKVVDVTWNDGTRSNRYLLKDTH